MADQDLLYNLDGATDDNLAQNQVIVVEPNEIIESADNKQLTVTDNENCLPATTKKGKLIKKREEKGKNNQDNEWDYTDFARLAELMNIPLSDLKDEFMLFQIRKLMSRMGKVLVRYNVSDSGVEKVFINSSKLQASEILVSPAYLPICEKIVKKHKLENPNVCTIIDFPFGESSFKSKINDLKDSARVGVDGITVTIPSMMTAVENVKTFKKQVKKIGRLYKKGSGIALNATDLDEQQIKRAIKLCARTRLSQITFAFGEATLDELKTKLNLINKHKGNKKIYVLANVDSAEAIMELFKLKVDKILTPFADSIGEELVKRFNVKSIKLK